MDANLTPYRIAHVVGARPQFVKLKPLAAAIADAGGMNWVAHTGQHYDVLMNDSFWVEMGFRPDYHGAWTRESADLEHLVDALRKARADAVVVYGDTDSTVLGAKAALELGLPLAHAEAGLRSFNALMPEEHNRVWVDRRAHWLWAPTDQALQQLNAEGLDTGAPWVLNTGDLMLDAFPRREPKDDLGGSPKRILITLHRNTNIDDSSRLRHIEQALDALSDDFEIIWPRHPRHRAAGLNSRLVPDCLPMGREELIDALYGAAWVITDSGGLQKEAFFAGRRGIVLRTETEWTELVDAGWTVLVDPDTPDLATALRSQIKEWLRCPAEVPPLLYGQGSAAKLMVKSLAEGLAQRNTT